jgi:hypothetical protein
MSSLSARRARILRIRKLEHCIAKARLRAADKTLGELERISGRLNTLQILLHPKADRTNGLELSAMGELRHRLSEAQNSLVQPISAADADREELHALGQAARLREEGAAKLHHAAKRVDEAAAALRADANRPVAVKRGGAR